jgi:hypothetical protein
VEGHPSKLEGEDLIEPFLTIESLASAGVRFTSLVIREIAFRYPYMSANLNLQAKELVGDISDKH